MGGKLLDLATNELLRKFGIGKHKPGSGSAAAFQGMLAAKLLVTVIKLSKDPKRVKNYKQHIQQLEAIQINIENDLYPALEVLFQKDSELFDEVIELRQERDVVKPSIDPDLYAQKATAVDNALRRATELPIEIANYCYTLAQYASIIFDKGFQSARGDSGAALNAAISGMGGCLSIITLNLNSLPTDDWMAKIRQQTDILKVNFEEVSVWPSQKLAILEQKLDEKWQLQQIFGRYRQGVLGKTIKTDQDMEKLVRDLQLDLWRNRALIWKTDEMDAMEVITPQDILQKVMGYRYIQAETLGMHVVGNDLVQVAGIIDKRLKTVMVSKQFPEEVVRFTTAHELGHLLLHEQAVLHRDKAFDISAPIPREPMEQQADKFAACLLMPTKVVKQVFFEIFGTNKLVINEATTPALRGGRDITAFRARFIDSRAFAKYIAQLEVYGGKSFTSMAKIFKVSPGSMAIRLIELDLITF